MFHKFLTMNSCLPKNLTTKKLDTNKISLEATGTSSTTETVKRNVKHRFYLYSTSQLHQFVLFLHAALSTIETE